MAHRLPIDLKSICRPFKIDTIVRNLLAGGLLENLLSGENVIKNFGFLLNDPRGF